MWCDLDERGKTNWVFNVRLFLSAHGFIYVWNTHGVGSIDHLANVLTHLMLLKSGILFPMTSATNSLLFLSRRH